MGVGEFPMFTRKPEAITWWPGHRSIRSEARARVLLLSEFDTKELLLLSIERQCLNSQCLSEPSTAWMDTQVEQNDASITKGRHEQKKVVFPSGIAQKGGVVMMMTVMMIAQPCVATEEPPYHQERRGSLAR